MDWGFESLRTHLIDAIVAQLVEHLTCNEDVSGSIPLNGSLRASIANALEIAIALSSNSLHTGSFI